MAELPVPSPDLVTTQDPQSKVSSGDIARSGDYIAQGADKLATGLDTLAIPLADQAGKDAAQQAVTRNPDGSLNVATPASSFILGRAGDAYADNAIAGTGAALRSKMDADLTTLRQQHQGDAAGYQQAAGAYIDRMAAADPGPIGDMVRQYGNSVAAQTRDGIVDQKAQIDTRASLDAQQGRVAYLENAMNGLAADGISAGLPQFAQMRAERDALLKARVNNPLAAYNADMKANDDAVFAQSLGTAAAVGHGRNLYEKTGNLSAALQATQDDLNAVPGLSEGQKIRATGEVAAHLRGLDATRQQDNQNFKDQADSLMTQSRATGNVPATQFESVAQQLEGRRLFAKAAEVRAQGLSQSYQPAILGGTAQEATDALHQIAAAAATNTGAGPAASPGAPVPAGGTGSAATPAYLAKVAQIESSGNPNAGNGPAKGLYQFMPATWARYGAGGDPTNVADANAAMVRLTNDNAAALTRSLGRAPTPGELYLAHQQGSAGAGALLANPGANAVQALSLVYGGDVAKAAGAVTGNGGNINMTAGQFAQKWIGKFDGSSSASTPFGASADGSPVVAYNALLKESYAAYNAHAQKLWDGMTQNGWDKGYAPTPAEMSDLRTMAPNVTDPKLRQDIQTRLQVEAAKSTFSAMPVTQQQDMVAAGNLVGQQGGLDNVQRQTLTALDNQVKHQVALAKDDPITYGQRYLPAGAKGGMTPIAPLDLSTPQGFTAALQSRQTVKGAAQKLDPSVGDMPFSGTDRDQLVTALQRGGGSQVSTILNGMAGGLTMPEMTAVTNDEKIRDAVIGNARSGDPNKVAAAYTFLGQQYTASPATFDHRFPGVGADLTTWQVKTAYQPPAVAAQQMVEAQTPQGIAARDDAKAAAEPYLKDLNASKVASMIAGSSIPFQGAGAPVEQASAGLMREFGDTFRDIYSRTGDQAQAQRLAVQVLQRTWGQSEFSGQTWDHGGALMKYPPEQVTNPKTGQPFYPEVAGSHSYISDQINATIDGYAQHAHPGWSVGEQADEARAMRGGTRMLIPDFDSNNEVAHGQPPGYQLMVQGSDGRFAIVPDPVTGRAQRLHFDPGPAQQQALGQAQAARKAYFENQALPAMGPM